MGNETTSSVGRLGRAGPGVPEQRRAGHNVVRGTGNSGEGDVDIINVRCGPILAGSLLGEKGFLPAYHMNKSHWITVLLNDTVSDDQITPLLELSYDSVAPRWKARNDSQNK